MHKVHLKSEDTTPSPRIPNSSGGSPDLWHSGTSSDTGIWGSVVQKRLIMVIDDSATVRKIVEVSLSREGLEVVSFPDGIEALQAVTSGRVKRIPDLIVLDIDLPKMNGYEIARYLRSKPQWKNTVIVILTRHDGLIDRLKARLAGAQAYLAKPFTTEMIVEIVNNSLSLTVVPVMDGQIREHASTL